MARFTLQLVEAVARDKAATARAISTLPPGIDQAALRSALTGQTRLPLAFSATQEALEPLQQVLGRAGFKTVIVELRPQGTAKPKTVTTLLSDAAPVREMAGFDWRENLGVIGLAVAGLLLVGVIIFVSGQFTRALPPPTADELTRLADVGAQARDAVAPSGEAGRPLKAGSSVAPDGATEDPGSPPPSLKGPPLASGIAVVALVIVLMVPVILRGWLNENLNPRGRLIVRLVIVWAGGAASVSSVIFAIPWLQQVTGFKAARAPASPRQLAQAAQVLRAGPRPTGSGGKSKKGAPMNLSVTIPMGMLASDSDDSPGSPEEGGPQAEGDDLPEESSAGGMPGGVNLDLKLAPGSKPGSATAKHWRMDKQGAEPNPLAMTSRHGGKPVKHFTHLFSKLHADKARKGKSQAKHGKFGALLDMFRDQAATSKASGGGAGGPMSLKVSGSVGGLASQVAALQKGAQDPKNGSAAAGIAPRSGADARRVAPSGGKGAAKAQRASKIDTSGLDTTDQSAGAAADEASAGADEAPPTSGKTHPEPPAAVASSLQKAPRGGPEPSHRPVQAGVTSVPDRKPQAAAEHKRGATKRPDSTDEADSADGARYPGEDRLPPQPNAGDAASQQARRDFEREARDEAAREGAQEGKGGASGSPAGSGGKSPSSPPRHAAANNAVPAAPAPARTAESELPPPEKAGGEPPAERPEAQARPSEAREPPEAEQEPRHTEPAAPEPQAKPDERPPAEAKAVEVAAAAPTEPPTPAEKRPTPQAAADEAVPGASQPAPEAAGAARAPEATAARAEAANDRPPPNAAELPVGAAPTAVPQPAPVEVPTKSPVRRGPFTRLLARGVASGSSAHGVDSGLAFLPRVSGAPAHVRVSQISALRTRLEVADVSAFDRSTSGPSGGGHPLVSRAASPKPPAPTDPLPSITFRQGAPVLTITPMAVAAGSSAVSRSDRVRLAAALLLGALLAGLLPWAWRLWRPKDTGVFQHDRPAVRYAAAGVVVAVAASAALVVVGLRLHRATKHDDGHSGQASSFASAFVGATGEDIAHESEDGSFGNLYAWLGRPYAGGAGSPAAKPFSTLLDRVRVDAAANVLWKTAHAATREARVVRQRSALDAASSERECTAAPLERARTAKGEASPGTEAAPADPSASLDRRTDVAARRPAPALVVRRASKPAGGASATVRLLTLMVGLAAGGLAGVLFRRRRETA